MAYRDVETRKLRDRERFRKRTEARRARGLCPRCGDHPPASGRRTCEPCAEKRRVSERARDRKRQAAGHKRRRNPAGERARERRRSAEQAARGLCAKCGREPPAPARRLCAGCGGKRRAADRARYARARAAGRLYGGKDPQAKRRRARERSRRRHRDRIAAGLCSRCGKRPAPEAGTVCESCREARRVSGRERYAERRAAGLCVACGQRAFGGESRCGVCAALEGERRDSGKKNAAARRRYAERRAAWRCTDCDRPSQGAARCEDCAKRSFERSDHFRGIPVWEPQFVVVELGTGECHGPFDTEAEAAASLVFAGLSSDQVEVVSDAPVTASLTGWA